MTTQKLAPGDIVDIEPYTIIQSIDSRRYQKTSKRVLGLCITGFVDKSGGRLALVITSLGVGWISGWKFKIL